jgi:hypothetical protein
MMAAVALDDDAVVVDPRAEARRRLDDRYDARVLEPSPPAAAEAPWFADDPVNHGLDGGHPVVAPVAGRGTTWDQLAERDAELASWCAQRWLGAWPRLQLPPDRRALVRTRQGWHALAEHVLAPARHRANGKIGLRYTRGGFGTPFYGDDEQVRVTGRALVVIRGEVVGWHTIKTVRAAADAVGIAPGAPADVYTPTTAPEYDEPLVIDSAAAAFLGDWFGFATSVLEELRASVPASDTPARVQLWPEHFDPSVDFGEEAAGHRATYGASPGDDGHELPYLYVTPWIAQQGEFWNEGSYASLSLADFVSAPDQRAAALDFFATARRQLAAGG